LEATYINHSFEAEKNRKALFYTLISCGLFLMLAIFYTWPMKIPPTPVVQDLIQINLGNEQEGMGDVQPMVKGERAPDNESVASRESSHRVREEPSQNIKADESKDETAAPVVKSEKQNKKAKIVNKEVITRASRNIHPSPIVNPHPAPREPKIPLYKGGNGRGGNGATADNGFRNQGYKPGNGDAGSPNGNPDSYGDSPTGRSGMSVVRGLSGRRPVHFPNMQGDFNENAKVYVDIQVNAAGKVISAVVSRGTTTSNPALRNTALEKARELKFPPAQSDLESGTILFVFVLKS